MLYKSSALSKKGEMEMKYSVKRKIKGTCFILPAFVIHFTVILIPALSMIYYAFTKWNGLNEPELVGFDNFRRMMRDYRQNGQRRVRRGNEKQPYMDGNFPDRALYYGTWHGVNLYKNRKSANGLPDAVLFALCGQCYCVR